MLAQVESPPGGFEVVIVNDGGVDVSPLVQWHAPILTIQLLHQEALGPAQARNLAARQARGEFLAFIDDDCWPDRLWLEAFSKQFEHHPEALLGGTIRNALDDSLFSEASQLILEAAFRFYNRDPEAPRLLVSGNLAVRRDRLLEAGGFSAAMLKLASEDRELCDRWRALGWPLRFVPEAIVYHAHELGLSRFWRQHFWYGRGAARFHWLRRQRRTSNWAEHIRFHLEWRRWLWEPLSRHPRRGRLALALILWQVANAVGFACE